MAHTTKAEPPFYGLMAEFDSAQALLDAAHKVHGAGYSLEYWTQVIDFPMNIGGRPFHAWVSFIPPAFETTILFAAFSAAIGMLALNGLPQPYHPVFNVERFTLASSEKFFLAIEATDPKFDASATRHFLQGLQATQVVQVEN